MDKGGPPNSRRLPIAQRRRDRHPPFIEPVQACFALQHLASTTVSSNVPPIRVPRIRLCHRVGFFGAPKHYRDFSRGWPGEGTHEWEGACANELASSILRKCRRWHAGGRGTFSGGSSRQKIWTISDAGMPKERQSSSTALARGD
jgi:hypothetical protein